MTNNAKIKKWLLGKDQIQNNLRNTGYRDEAESVAVKCFDKKQSVKF